MPSPRVRLLVLLSSLPVFTLLFALVYMQGMAHLEEAPRDFWSSVGWAAETLSTTGYGGDSHWRHPLMVLFVATVQFLGVFLVFLVFPIYLIPFLEQRLQAPLPRTAPKLSDHVLVFRHGPAVESLVEELVRHKTPYLIIEPDERTARALLDRRRRVVYRPEGEDALADVGLSAARC